jgi:hypothetical protein
LEVLLGQIYATRGAPWPDPLPSLRKREDPSLGYVTTHTCEREAMPPRVTLPRVGRHTKDPLDLGLDLRRPTMDPPNLSMDMRH